jgi:uncharacterized protein
VSTPTPVVIAQTAVFTQFVLKVHSRCDLACDHCYVYEARDQNWRRQPREMPTEVLDAILDAVAAHCRRHGVRADLVLHGGEPLLLGTRGMSRLLERIRQGLPEFLSSITVQTNGVRLDRSFASLFAEYDVQVGISLDGGQVANDRHRRFSDGRGSHAFVHRAVTLMGSNEYRPWFAGLLATVDVANDARHVMAELLSYAPPRLDLLLPHATWDWPPPASAPDRTVYGDWLVTAFDHWVAHGGEVKLRLFDELIRVLLGGASRSEVIGRSVPASVIVETDGSIELTDALKAAFEGASHTGLDVRRNSFDDLVALAPGALSGQLCAECRACALVEACGGGLYAHRHGRGRDFENPSVYCHDLARLVRHVQDRIHAEVPAAVVTSAPGPEPARAARAVLPDRS